MKVVRFYAPGKVEIEESAEPVPRAGEVKVRVRACCLCGTDLKTFRHGHHRISPPRVLGHEIAGEVAELGAGVRGWSAGDRVQVIGAIPCGRCADCRRGRPTVCGGLEAMGYHYDGGLADFLVVPAKVLRVGGLNRVPDAVGFAEAALAEPLACVLNGQELAGVAEGDVVAVVGGGPIGCMHVRLARARGAARVILVELVRRRLDRAARLVSPDDAVCAADGDVAEQVMDLTGGRGADVVLLANASGAAQEQAFRYAAGRGRISLFGSLPPGEPAPPLAANLVHYRELTVVGANASHPAQNARALELIASGAVPVADLITHRLGLDGFHRGLDLIERGEAVKVALSPDHPAGRE